MFPNPRIAASACLMGKPTRYDGGNKKSHILACQVSKVFELISVCPEVDIGLPTPRNPVALVQNFDVQLIGTIDNDKDITNEIVDYSRRFARQNAIICGLIVKASSPSCGYKSATVYRKSGKSRYGVNGLFTSAFLAAKPWVPIIDENDLQNLDMRIFFMTNDKCRQHARSYISTRKFTLVSCSFFIDDQWGKPYTLGADLCTVCA